MESMARPWLEVQEAVECWDDDEDLQLHDGFQFRAASSAGSVANSSVRPSGHRDSISSRRSARSDLESNAGDEDWQILLPEGDEISKEELVASATHAKIPIPADVPKSALVGGVIKRLGEKKAKRTFVDDWSDEVELPGPDTDLKLRTPRDTTFPESIRQINSATTSPVKPTASPSWNEDMPGRLEPALTTNGGVKDQYETPVDHNVLTLKASQSPPKTSFGLTTVPTGAQERDDCDTDLELPPAHQPLQLSQTRKEAHVPSPTLEDFDIDWSEGSIGVRVGGTTRDGRSLPSSSISIASPSVSSCITGESEEDALDGIVFPEGPLDFYTSLKKQQESHNTKESAENIKNQEGMNPRDSEDFFSGLETDNGKAFASGKLSLNPNVKRRTEWPTSPTRRSETTLTFTHAAGSPRTRIPRLSGHEKTHSTALETVSESGVPISKFHRSQSRFGHASQSSVSSIPSLGAVSTSPTPSVAARRLPESRSRDSAPVGDSKLSSRTLRNKRSLPAIRGGPSSAATAHSVQRPPPHSDGAARPFPVRPKTPVDRSVNDGKVLGLRAISPFVQAATSERQSQHAGVKSHRFPRRANSDCSGDLFGPQGSVSRLSRSSRSDRPRLSLGDAGLERTDGSAKRALTRPTRRRNFGDGTELASFDDLPTSASAESKFIKTPSGRGAPRSVRAKLSQSRVALPRYSPTQDPTPPSTKLNTTPRFARDTNASRNAREQRIASMVSRTREVNSHASSNPSWKPHPVSRISPNALPLRSRKVTSSNKPPSKPQLIKPMGTGVQEAKCMNTNEPLFYLCPVTRTNRIWCLAVNGMHYNPVTFVWEGNENLMQDFESATLSKSPKSTPALIANVGTMQNVQAVGGMIFDPHRMCWLRAATINPGAQDSTIPGDEEDVFAGLDDLEDKPAVASGRVSGGVNDFTNLAASDDPSAGESSDEGPITEEFDVGPEFIRRQRAEEEKWRRKVDKWIGHGRGDHEIRWRWAIRDIVADEEGRQAV